MPKPSKELFDIKIREVPIEEVLEQEVIPEDIKAKYRSDIRYLREHGQEPGTYPGISAMQSVSYPNYDYNINRSAPADTNKWLEAARQVFYLTHNGEDRGRALEKVISKWSRTEQQSFYYWLRFYEEGGHLKYKAGDLDPMNTKTAQMPSFQIQPPRPTPNPIQFFDGVKQPGYFMPHQPGQAFDQMRAPQTHPDMLADEHRKRMEAQEQERKEQVKSQEQEKREQIEEMRAKVLSRLDSAEKLFRSREGHMLAMNELGAFVDGIHRLKQQVITVNKRSLSTRLYEDMIVREANVLTKNGFNKCADVLHKIAQAIPNQPEANNPLQMGGVSGNIPGQGPGMTPSMSISNNDSAAPLDPAMQADNPAAVGSPTALPLPPPASGMTQSSPTDMPQPGGPSPGMKAFLDSLEDGNNSNEDEDEDEKLSAASLALGLKLQAALVLERYLALGFVKEAQEAPQPPMDDISEPTPATDPEVAAGTDFDKVIDTAFQQLTVADVVSRLEDLTKVFKVREIPRQLAIVDMMLDRLGLASFFPSLGECVQKSHEANNYVSSRLEDILAALRGTLKTKNIDLAGDNVPSVSPSTQSTQNQLRQEQETEQNRKKMRKDVSNRELEQANKPKPDLEVAEDLGAAVPQMPAPTVPPAPAPPGV